MIATLTGILRCKTPPMLVLEVNQVGYEIYAPMTTFYQLPELNQTTQLFTHLCIREDAHQLYGFKEVRERELFRLLIKVNGIGPKLALGILSGIESTQLIQAVMDNDTNRLIKIPGIGKKTAERLLLDCKDAFQKITPSFSASPNPATTAYDDAIEALTALGFKPLDAKKSVDRIYKTDKKTEELIRQALALIV